MKNRDLSIDFIRVLCAIGIIVFHFYSHTDNHLTKFFCRFVNGSYGNTIVNIFFLISGGTLYYNNSTISRLKVFYYKRFKSIFPIFYFTFIVFYIVKVMRTHNFFYGGHPSKLVLSLMGVDGYFSYLAPNYYLIGEWFLGAIVMLYALYPLLLKLFNKSVDLTTIIVFILYSVVFVPNVFKVDPACNLLSCLISFELGMVFMKYKPLWEKSIILFLFSIGISLVIIFVKIDFIHENIYNHALAVCLFFVLSFVGRTFMKNKICKKFFSELSGISFAIFLLQHIVIMFFLEKYMPRNDLFALLWLLAIILVTIILGKILTMINSWIFKTRLFVKLDEIF